ncbi:MAG: hypothetical protein M1815_001074 [Lichina confinis]|nr:MAG: hypothetical protein M1815_001074 [Lichina confinis]
MLLVHQTGSVKVGEVVRYTFTYTPALDRILPTPSTLHVRIRNTSAIPLRAAYLHGPYTIHVATYPSSFNPNRRAESPADDGVPQFEPQLKAGGSWDATLRVPESIRGQAEMDWAKQTHVNRTSSLTWIIEITSQIVFSSSATVHYELLVGRDETSLSLPVPAASSGVQSSLSPIEDHQPGTEGKQGHYAVHPKGVFSKAVHIVVEDTASLWSKPPLPSFQENPGRTGQVDSTSREAVKEGARRAVEHSGRPTTGATQEGTSKPKRVHLVILTHGLHSNLGADLLYLKESIDDTAREAREEAQRRRQRQRERGSKDSPRRAIEEQGPPPDGSHRPSDGAGLDGVGDDGGDDGDDDGSEEEVIVRGFAENVARTERGIKYLGKRLAQYVLRMTYPHQPYLPAKTTRMKSNSVSSSALPPKAAWNGDQTHPHSSLHERTTSGEKLPYEISSISFIGHSLGGLVQTYAIAYIQKHSPQFFETIKPINFVAMSTPFLGLSHENPLYVKFALDFGLVGRTGQDLGLAWSPPTIARSGWSALIAGLGTGAQRAKRRQQDPSAKPLLRILPTGPAHKALQTFRNRTVYANVVNDGIVPLRTSCLLFLDWSSLGRIEKARREVGLVGTMAEWGWAELTGSNVSGHHGRNLRNGDGDGDGDGTGAGTGTGGAASDQRASQVPEPSVSAAKDNTSELAPRDPEPHQALVQHAAQRENRAELCYLQPEPLGALTGFLTTLLPAREKNAKPASKESKVYKRGQTVHAAAASDSERSSPPEGSRAVHDRSRPETPAPSGDSKSPVKDAGRLLTPPRTTFFESAGALLNPPLPPRDYLVEPTSRPRTIFHDRVYHPSDIPPPPVRRPMSFVRSLSGMGDGARSHRGHGANRGPEDEGQPGGMTVEEKIARAYHKDMSWRKVLVRLEPDAHNNIIVRRRFANAYGWPVVKHLVDTHFSGSEVATVRDDEQFGQEHAKDIDQGVGERGEEVEFHAIVRSPTNDVMTGSEAHDEAGKLGSGRHSADTTTTTTTTSSGSSGTGSSAVGRPSLTRADSFQWSEADFDATDDDDGGADEDEDEDVPTPRGGIFSAIVRAASPSNPSAAAAPPHSSYATGAPGGQTIPVASRSEVTITAAEPDEFSPSSPVTNPVANVNANTSTNSNPHGGMVGATVAAAMEGTATEGTVGATVGAKEGTSQLGLKNSSLEQLPPNHGVVEQIYQLASSSPERSR